jgi:hypothetical protein
VKGVLIDGLLRNIRPFHMGCYRKGKSKGRSKANPSPFQCSQRQEAPSSQEYRQDRAMGEKEKIPDNLDVEPNNLEKIRLFGPIHPLIIVKG